MRQTIHKGAKAACGCMHRKTVCRNEFDYGTSWFSLQKKSILLRSWAFFTATSLPPTAALDAAVFVLVVGRGTGVFTNVCTGIPVDLSFGPSRIDYTITSRTTVPSAQIGR